MSRPFKWNWNLRLQLLLFLQFGWLLQRACLSAEYNSCQSLRLSSFWLIETFPSGSFNRFCWLARKVNSFSTLRTPLCGHANENAWELSSSKQSSSGCSAAFGGSVVSFSLLTAGSTWQRGAAGPISDVTVFQPLLWTPPPSVHPPTPASVSSSRAGDHLWRFPGLFVPSSPLSAAEDQRQAGRSAARCW